jgi:hypothetical protein
MKINRNNYEAFFLDYHEGNLSDELKQELFSFLAVNPDLKEEFENFEIISLNPKPDIKFFDKNSLKKNIITSYNYKTWFVAYLENDLKESERREVEQFVEKNPGYTPELEILKQTHILPDFNIRFENKSSLKKGGVTIPMWARVAAAACLVIGFIGYWGFSRKEETRLVQSNSTELGNKEKQEAPSNTPQNAESKRNQPVKVIAQPEQVKNHFDKKPDSKKSKQMQKEIKLGTILATVDSTPVLQKENLLVAQPLAQNQDNEPKIIINANQKKNSAEAEYARKNFVVLDENDLVDLGLKTKNTDEKKSNIKSSVAEVGKLLGLDTHYSQEQNLLQASLTETLAFGPVEITRTIPR